MNEAIYFLFPLKMEMRRISTRINVSVLKRMLEYVFVTNALVCLFVCFSSGLGGPP